MVATLSQFSAARAFFYVCTHSFLERFVFVYLVIAKIIKNENAPTMMISLVLVAHEVSRTLLDIPSALIADKIGAVKVMIIGVLLKTIGLLCLYYYKPFLPLSFFLVMSLFGAGSGMMRSKIDPYIYQNLKVLNKEGLFTRLAIARNISSNSAALLSGMIVKYFYSNDSLHRVALISVVMMLAVHIPFLLFLNKYNFSSARIDRKLYSIKYILLDAFGAIRRNRSVAFLFFILSIVESSFFTITDIYKATIAHVKMPIDKIGMIYSAHHFLPMLVSVICLAKNFRLTMAVTLVIYCLLVGFIALTSFLTTNENIIMFAVSLFLSLFPIIRVSLIKDFEDLSLNHARFTMFSFVSLTTSLLNIVFFTLFGGLTQFMSHEMGIFSIASSILTLCIIILCIYKKNVVDNKRAGI